MTEKPISFVNDTFSAEEKRAIAVERWKRDGVKTLAEGVSLVPHGRAASIYLRNGNRFMAFYAELEGVSDVDVCVYIDRGLSSWFDIDSFLASPVSPDERRQAIQAVKDWLDGRGTKFAFYPQT